MKNLINYYYNLLVNDFRRVDDRFISKIDGKNYELVPFYGDINEFYKNYMTLINNNRYCHEVVLNKDKSLLTFYGDKSYLLIKENINIEKKVDMNEIVSYDIIVRGEYNLNWKNLWKEKIDYYEYQMNQLSFKHKMLKDSFNYYVGLTETAISLLNYIDDSKIDYYICHKRINYNEKLSEFFNPINIIIDTRTRDIAEYIKTNYINENLDIKEVYFYLDRLNFNYVESILFLSRLLYPSYYFDVYDEIIQERISEEKMNEIIKKNTACELFLKQVYSYLKGRYNIPEIEWLGL